jgi:hypothetical protein
VVQRDPLRKWRAGPQRGREDRRRIERREGRCRAPISHRSLALSLSGGYARAVPAAAAAPAVPATDAAAIPAADAAAASAADAIFLSAAPGLITQRDVRFDPPTQTHTVPQSFRLGNVPTSLPLALSSNTASPDLSPPSESPSFHHLPSHSPSNPSSLYYKVLL